MAALEGATPKAPQSIFMCTGEVVLPIAIDPTVPSHLLRCVSPDELLLSALVADPAPLAVVLLSSSLELLARVRSSSSKSTFILVYPGDDWASSVSHRLSLFAYGANMIANSASAVNAGLLCLLRQQTLSCGAASGPKFRCHVCGLDGLSENSLHLHFPLYHSSSVPRNPRSCPICLAPSATFHRSSFACHLHNNHGPPEDREPLHPSFAVFSWVVCRRSSDGKYLVVHEPAPLCHGRRPALWLPAGRVDCGETLIEAAERETLEEGGVRVKITGLLKVMMQKGTPRVVLLAEPVDLSRDEAKSVPDFESCGAVWTTLHDLERLHDDDFRSRDPPALFKALETGALKTQSIEGKEFKAFNQSIANITRLHSKAAEEELEVAWRELKCVLPEANVYES